MRAQKPVAAQHEADRILRIAASHFGVEPFYLLAPGRERSRIRARHITMAIMREHLDMSYTELAQYWGGCDHTTVLNAVKRARVKRMNKPKWAEDFSALECALLPWREESEIEKLELCA